MMVKLSIQNVVYPIRSHLRLIQNFIVFTLSIALLSTSKRLFTPMSGISRLVFSGGGVKGVIYPGVYRALDETGLLSTMTQVSGSSIGSVVAGFLAVGMTSNEFRDALLPIQLNELLGTTTWSFFKKNPPGCFPTSKTGFPFEQWVRVHLISTVNRFLLTCDTSTVPELDELKNRLMNDNQASFTFADLDLLNKYFPKKFKKAIIIATHYPEATLAIFNSKTTPQVDIAKAIRASSSLPILLVPAEINGTMYIDGGVLDNVPTNYFEEESNSLHPTHTQKDSTLILAFKDKSNPKDDPLCRALDQSSLKYSKSLLYKPDWYDKFTLDLLLGRLIGVRFNEQVTKSIDNSFQRIRMDYPFRTVALPSGGLALQDFAKAQKWARSLQALAYLETVHFLLTHHLCPPKRINHHDLFTFVSFYFLLIYRAVLAATHQEQAKDQLLQHAESLLHSSHHGLVLNYSDPISCRRFINLVKERCEFHPESLASFSLSRALEYYHHDINSTQLATEMMDKANVLAQQKKVTSLYRFFSHQKTGSAIAVDKINEAVECLRYNPN